MLLKPKRKFLPQILQCRMTKMIRTIRYFYFLKCLITGLQINLVSCANARRFLFLNVHFSNGRTWEDQEKQSAVGTDPVGVFRAEESVFAFLVGNGSDDSKYSVFLLFKMSNYRLTN